MPLYLAAIRLLRVRLFRLHNPLCELPALRFYLRPADNPKYRAFQRAKIPPFPPAGRLSAVASDGIRVGWRGLFVFIWSAPRAVGFWGGLRSIIVGIYRQKCGWRWRRRAGCGDRYIAPVGDSGSIDVCVSPRSAMVRHFGFPSS